MAEIIPNIRIISKFLAKQNKPGVPVDGAIPGSRASMSKLRWMGLFPLK